MHFYASYISVIQIELLGINFVQKEFYKGAISEKKKVFELLKGVIDTKVILMSLLFRI